MDYLSIAFFVVVLAVVLLDVAWPAIKKHFGRPNKDQ